MGTFHRLRNRILGCTSGNAAMIVALGMPALMGGAGLAVDTAQWYLWQRELQFATDQAALAGAWARGNGDTGSAYVTRADQEFEFNLSVTSDASPTHTASLADYDTGTDNSVVVTAEVTADLPFASFLLGRATTIRTSSQAAYETTDEYTACLVALHKSASKALWLNGGPTVDAACGLASFSQNANSIVTNGNTGPQNINTVVAAGGISDGAGAFGNAETEENFEGLEDPYAGLTPPDNPTPRTLSCASSSVTYTADETVDATESYNYYRGRNASQAERDGTISYAGAQPSTTNTTVTYANTFTSLPVGGTSQTSGSLYQIAGSGPDKIYEQLVQTLVTSYSNISMSGGSSGAVQPGTYSSFEISCDTTLAGGVYVIDGGRLKLNGGNKLTGTGVMFVLKNGAEIDINGGAEVFLTPMSALELMAVGVSAEDAGRMEGMLIFEDPDSPGSSGSKLTGGADFDLNGVIYLPNSDLQLAGNVEATAECLMIMASTLKVSGTANLTTLCPVGEAHEKIIGGGGTRVRLVA
ncbi:MAG: hypothetical protein EP341_10180 [Sphingomonadales bacterium]|nr:MAG: hypothetical protein EP341_10180 [Sphingomonadales bacterium]